MCLSHSNTEHLLDLLEDAQATLAMMLTSRHIGPLRDEAAAWAIKLKDISEVLDQVGHRCSKVGKVLCRLDSQGGGRGDCFDLAWYRNWKRADFPFRYQVFLTNLIKFVYTSLHERLQSTYIWAGFVFVRSGFLYKTFGYISRKYLATVAQLRYWYYSFVYYYYYCYYYYYYLLVCLYLVDNKVIVLFWKIIIIVVFIVITN